MDKNGILVALSQSDRTEFGKDNFATQSIPQKVFSSVWALESEVNNGGFSQYFFNHSAETASFIVEALHSIGALNTANICTRAIVSAFPMGLPQNREAISEMAADFSDEVLQKLEMLDAEFYAYPDNLTELLFTYVSVYPQEFGKVTWSE